MRVCHQQHPEDERYCEQRHGHAGAHRYAVHTINYVYWYEPADDWATETKVK